MYSKVDFIKARSQYGESRSESFVKIKSPNQSRFSLKIAASLDSISSDLDSMIEKVDSNQIAFDSIRRFSDAANRDTAILGDCNEQSFRECSLKFRCACCNVAATRALSQMPATSKKGTKKLQKWLKNSTHFK